MTRALVLNGQQGGLARAAINNNFAQFEQRARRFSPVYGVFDGDSKGAEIQSAMDWFIGFEGLDVRTDGGYLGVGSSLTGSSNSAPLGLTSTTRMATATTLLNGHSAAGRTVDYFLTIGTNDISAAVLPSTILANIRKFHEQVLRPQSCFRYLILMSIDPRTLGLSEATTSAVHTVNRLYDEYALANPFDVIYIDTTNALLDPSAANVLGGPLPYTVTATPAPYGSVTDDGLHCSNYGKYRKRFTLTQLREVYRRKPQRSLSQGLVATASGTAGSGANMVKGRTVALGGTNSITNNGTGSITGTPPANFTATGTLDGSISVTFTAVNVVIAEDGLLPKGTWPAVRIAISGATGSATNRVELVGTGTPGTGGIAIGDKVTGGALVAYNDLVGFLGMAVAANNNSAVRGKAVGQSNVNVSPLAQAIAEPITGPFLIEADDLAATSAQNNFNFSAVFYLPPNTTISGSVDVFNVFAERIGQIPAAAA